MMNFDFSSQEPIYLQVAHQLEQAIFEGTFTPGDQVPSTTEISKTFHINPATVLKGMNILVDEGLLQKQRGRGMFVTDKAHDKLMDNRRQSFYQDYIVNMLKEAHNLGISEDELIQLIKRGVK